MMKFIQILSVLAVPIIMTAALLPAAGLAQEEVVCAADVVVQADDRSIF